MLLILLIILNPLFAFEIINPTTKFSKLFLKFPCVFASQAYKGLDAHKISLSDLDTAGEQAREI